MIVITSSPVDVTEGVCIGLSHERWKPLKLISWVNLEPQKHDIEQRFYDSSRTLILIDKGMDRYDSWQSCQWLSPNKKNHLRGECSKWPQPPTYQLVARFSHNLQPKLIKKSTIVISYFPSFKTSLNAQKSKKIFFHLEIDLLYRAAIVMKPQV